MREVFSSFQHAPVYQSSMQYIHRTHVMPNKRSFKRMIYTQQRSHTDIHKSQDKLGFTRDILTLYRRDIHTHTISQHKLGFTRDIHTDKKYTATTRSWLKLRVRLFIIHQTYEQKTQAGGVTYTLHATRLAD